jgi:hypothetical protein
LILAVLYIPERSIAGQIAIFAKAINRAGKKPLATWSAVLVTTGFATSNPNLGSGASR